MIWVYINYPNRRITIHGSPACGAVMRHGKPHQRVVRIGPGNLDEELERFIAGRHRFASGADVNDMWLAVGLGDEARELEVMERIRRLLGELYTPLATVVPQEHCCH
jgi:hypothetical protein